VKLWNTSSAPFRVAIKEYLTAYDKATNAGGGNDAPASLADALRMAAIRDRQLAARLGPRVLSILSEHEVGPGAPPDDVLNIVIKLAPKVINERLEKATFQESPAEAAALDSMLSAVW
jgi:hypothetical protein